MPICDPDGRPDDGLPPIRGGIPCPKADREDHPVDAWSRMAVKVKPRSGDGSLRLAFMTRMRHPSTSRLRAPPTRQAQTLRQGPNSTPGEKPSAMHSARRRGCGSVCLSVLRDALSRMPSRRVLRAVFAIHLAAPLPSSVGTSRL